MTTALVLVDLQNDYFPGGAMELVGSPQAVTQAARLLEAARTRGWPIFHIQHLARPGGTFFLPGTHGANIHPEVAPRAGETHLTKHFPNAFRETALEAGLRQAGIQQLLVAGAMSHMCIDATVRAAFDLGFACTVAENACATRDLNFGDRHVPAAQVHAAFMAALSAPYARVVSTDAALAG